jgi:hypothetical protein
MGPTLSLLEPIGAPTSRPCFGARPADTHGDDRANRHAGCRKQERAANTGRETLLFRPTRPRVYAIALATICWSTRRDQPRRLGRRRWEWRRPHTGSIAAAASSERCSQPGASRSRRRDASAPLAVSDHPATRPASTRWPPAQGPCGARRGRFAGKVQVRFAHGIGRHDRLRTGPGLAPLGGQDRAQPVSNLEATRFMTRTGRARRQFFDTSGWPCLLRSAD